MPGIRPLKTTAFSTAALLLLLLAPAGGFCQGVLVVVNNHQPVPLPRPVVWRRSIPAPQPVNSYKIKELTVNARIMDQVARTQVTQTFVNTGSRQMEVQFVFPLPYDGAVDGLTFMVDGKEYEAKILPAKQARSIYEGYIRRNKDPALLEWMGHGMFKTSVFPVPAGAERKVTMRYSQLLRKDHQLTDFLFPLSTAKYTSHAVEKVQFQIAIETTGALKSVYSPTHAVDVIRSDKQHAVVKYEVKNQVPTSDFRLMFDTGKGQVGASVVSYRPEQGEDGYFLLMASPEFKAASAKRPAKTAVLVVDRSGSMAGKKMDQTKEALKFVVNNLRPGDQFNIIAYDSAVESFKPALQTYNEANRKKAIGFIEGLYAGGSTNISGALTAALEQIGKAQNPAFIVFMTDGRPTAGETNEAKIVASIAKANTDKTRLVSFGVGYDVNSRLLDKLSRENFGQSEFVRPDEDIEAHVSRLYNKIDSPVLSDVVVQLEFDEQNIEDGAPINRMYPGKVRDLFEGEQLIVVGRYKKTGVAKVKIEGKVGGKTKRFDFPAELAASSSDQTYAFVEKLWAMRRVGQIIDELDLHGKNDELIQELVAISTRHGILTPYTSFLADDQAPAAELSDRRGNESRTRALLMRLDEFEGRAAFAQRSEKNRLRQVQQVPADSGFGVVEAPEETAAEGDAKDHGRKLPAVAAAKPSSQPAADPAGQQGNGKADDGAAAPGLGPAVKVLDIDSDKEVAAYSVRIAGGETLYKRGKAWYAANAADVDLAKDTAKLEEIKRFTDAYFKLIAENTAKENAVLARQQEGEELIIRLRGKLYRIR